MGSLRPSLLSVLFLPTIALSQLLPPDDAWVEQTLRGMTLEEKIGQLFFPVHSNLERTMSWVVNYNIGGIWFPRTEAGRIARELNALQEASKYPLLVTVDFEKGAGTYVDGATDLPINMALGASRNPRLAYEAARLTAMEARAIGVHLNFAPVLDVNNNPKNPIVNTRSYGEDPKLVAQMAQAAILGYHESGMLSTGKHFPGHGNTDVDSHAMLGVVESSKEEFESIELHPYREVLSGTPPSSIMSAHLWIKAVDADTVPATLSPKAIDGLLRTLLGFDGIIFTDAMVMGGITTRYPFEAATVKALKAGCDVILFPGDLVKGIEAVRRAAAEGELTEERIDASVRRILRAKTRVGLHRVRLVDVARIPELVGTEENYNVARWIASQCITLVKDDAGLLPLNSAKKILVLTTSNEDRPSMLSRGIVSFPDEMKKRAGSVTHFRLSDSLTDEEEAQALELASGADVVVVAAYIKIVLNSGTIELPERHIRFMERLRERNGNVVLVSFGNPYIGGSVPWVPTYVCAFDNAVALQDATAEALFGLTPFTGKLPVTISEKLRYGSGLMSR